MLHGINYFKDRDSGAYTCAITQASSSRSPRAASHSLLLSWLGFAFNDFTATCASNGYKVNIFNAYN